MTKTVLITGCSSGFGKLIVLRQEQMIVDALSAPLHDGAALLDQIAAMLVPAPDQDAA